MFDVFYTSPLKPNLFTFEKPAKDLADAAHQSRTEFFWLIDGLNDYEGFDFEWQPAPWESHHVHVFPSQHQPNGNVYFSRKDTATNYEWNFRTEQSVRRLGTYHQWKIPTNINIDSFDFSWHPNPLDPAYLYEFPTQWNAEGGPVYVVDGATEYKYMDTPVARIKQTRENWTIHHPIREDLFDFSWAPHPKDPPYNYVFGNQWFPGTKMPTVEYKVPDATETKYMEMQARLRYEYTNWTALYAVSMFDYSWVPDPQDPPYIYVFGNQHYPGTIMPTMKYTVPGATEEKFVDFPIATLSEDRENWTFLEAIDVGAWDFTWVPNPKDPPYIYDFGNQWNPAEYKASVRYTVPGATETKYMEKRTRRLPYYGKQWHINFEIEEFDYSWEPNPFDPPMDYVFGNQWNPGVIQPTIVYKVEGATEVKYVDDIVAKLSQNPKAWTVLDDIKDFDYSWVPNPTEPPYIYIFGNQWLTPEMRPALKYTVPSATEIKYMDEPKAQRIGNPEKFVTLHACDFDYSWEPDPGSPPYNYVFGNQHWPANIMPTVQYNMKGATEIKYVDEPFAKLKPGNWMSWITNADGPIEFDYSWVPDPGEPEPYIYIFGNQWYPAEEMNTVEFRMVGAVGRKYIDTNRAKLLPIMDRWSVPEEVDASAIDFSWVPHPKDEPYVHHFGSEFQMSMGLTYTVPGATEPKFEGEPPLLAKERKAVQVLDIFYLDKSNFSSAERYRKLQEKYPNIQKIRYVNSNLDTIQRCIAKAKTSKFWVISSENVYDDFDFAWHAQPWQSYMTHVFGSQWDKWTDTFLINKWEFERHTKWAKTLAEFPNLNFVKDRYVKTGNDNFDMYFVDHGNADNSLLSLKSRYPKIKQTRFVDNQLDALRRIMNATTSEYVWVTSSMCDYTAFDFTWTPEPWQSEMIHCFGTEFQKRGDTFYIHAESFKTQMTELELLDWFNVICYHEENLLLRYDPEHVHYNSDNLVEEIKKHEFKGPYAMFMNRPGQLGFEPCLWTQKDRTVMSATRDNGCVAIPRDIKQYLKTQVYDYPYIDKSFNRSMSHGIQLDVIFISNGEPDADKYWNKLLSFVPWAKRSDGVKGRTQAYQAAARMSTTHWFLAVFAKLDIEPDFNWDWQPDLFQEPKHYIFNSKNPLNGLEYGHQGMIAYNKKLVLENNNPGLDFTLSQPHESVPILSGTACFNQDEWTTWRTAFREVIKLKKFESEQSTIEGALRLRTWITKAEGDYAEWCLRGAADAVEYFDAVKGNHSDLQLSFEWSWLREYFKSKNY